MRRPTIVDIARAAGVSKGAVSYALNGRPGVSEPTRRRILEIAAELGWAPSSAARALSDGRAGAIGLVVDRPAQVLGSEPFFMRLIAGIQSALAGGPTALLLQVSDDATAEIATYRRWYAERRVDGVLLVDLRVADPRITTVAELGLPAVVIGGPDDTGALSCVWSDDDAAMRAVVDHLAGLGHRRIARVAGPAEFVHTRARSAAFHGAAADLGLDGAQVAHADYSGEEGARLTRELLAAPEPPTALIFDNDLMAVAALGVAQDMGVQVPDRLSIVAWDDSPLCRTLRPALTAVRRDVVDYGEQAARLLLRLVDGGPPARLAASAFELVPRGSTGPFHPAG
ncbi:LacI family DNA-binding transcriptional regulator [Allonocardiopsis opalescens]|uniref:LacI family transcriptional regulator n=1 Tax=Allonocardiopsis opalescens TaxID=1144618 RepID=A0A2T0PZT7_9ACTN|nr:LacI family DNA-binding transcriptional regulator [Allonocardiopsis opalescens]PRX97044.1 LacI family transcriptional regulator [Allonocardiopsis opalescens]